LFRWYIYINIIVMLFRWYIYSKPLLWATKIDIIIIYLMYHQAPHLSKHQSSEIFCDSVNHAYHKRKSTLNEPESRLG